MSSVKICGFQQPETVRSIIHLPIDHIGFVFAKSKRQVTPRQAGEMMSVLKERRAVGLPAPLAVGVFVNPTQAELTAVMEHAPLDGVQLHGQESPEECRWVKEAFPGVQVWKVISVTQLKAYGESALGAPNEGNASRESAFSSNDDVSRRQTASAVAAMLDPYKDVVDGILLDTFDPVYGGGSGKTFAWEAIPPYQAWCREAGVRLMVAGGLQAGNVQELVDAFAPDGVDVSSGVETDGVKDVNKIISFVERVKQHV